MDTIEYWQVSPGREERGFWPEFKSANMIAMGWDSLGDLERYGGKEDIENALRRHYPVDYPADKYPANDINSIWIFSKLIKEGDVILAKKGASREVYGIGKVTRRYHFVETRENFKHVIDVDWLIGFDEKIEVEITRKFVQWTAHSLPQSRFDEVKQSILSKFPDLDDKFSQLMEGPKQAVSQPGNWWIEKTIVRGRADRETGPYALGEVLWSPQKDKRGADIYKNMREISEGDLVLHLVNNRAIVGVSVVEKEFNSDFLVPRGTRWDDGTGRRPGYAVALKGFKPLRTPVDRNDFLNDEYRQQLLSLIDQGHEVFYNKYLGLREGAYLTRVPHELLEVFNEIYKDKTGEDLPYISEIGIPTTHLHLIHKIAWHPGGYKGGFCGDAQSAACEAFEYIRKRKKEDPCSPTVHYCVDEDEAFAESGWRVRIHPPRIKKLHELSENTSLVFLVAPLTKSKTRYRLVGFYTINQKAIENGNVIGLSADRNLSSKFDLEEQKLEYSNIDLKKLFGIRIGQPAEAMISFPARMP